ncbi:GNS1/SUR4 family-domain-containing protein [Dichotomopilus funicola]|uniref:Elongation of fatty acids protein n=1 Tax=Dichotomopilus funicola TaxID=1934379 RepID=A0AAN6ZJ33_9PEZI|nr:GNS1/SUR4 family-domain-containing protein [Dichotomopilus funicola]
MGFESVTLSLPQASLFQFPPNPNSGFIPPPPTGSTSFAPPVDIPDHLYNAVLDAKVPITIALVYAVTAKALNAYNKSTNKKPWAISKTLAFRWFVIAHNVFLAVYSAWTWWGMLGTLRRSLVSPLGPQGVSGLVDSLCRVNGAGGLGNAAFFDDSQNVWQTYSPEAVLDAEGMPSRFVAGRMWNEGLAFYGWLFYLSKFYEVVDTLIILAKGKYSSTLQTYHHAGAMMCMWAGMRYMSVPIWIFVFFNSFIHALMYTYYTVTAFNVRVPVFIKRTLTSMQITQFLVGASCAMIHSFVKYSIPVIASSQTDAPASAASASANNTVIAATGSVFGNVKGTYARRTMSCITSSGETFAVWLNVFYLAPLTYLFVSFFIESYLRRSNAGSRSNKRTPTTGLDARRLSNNVQLAEKAGWEAARNVEREVYGESNEEAIISESQSTDAQPTPSGRVLRSRRA